MKKTTAKTITPQVIDDEPHEQVHERVAGIDVGKKEATVCTRLPHPARPGTRQSVVWTVTATMPAVRALAARLLELRIEKITIESTSDYWRLWFYVLAAAGLDVQLVPPAHVRQLRGRPKTDKLDAIWLARLTERGLLRPSFVPAAQIRALRQYARARTALIRDRTRAWQRLEKLLEDALIKISAVASTLNTKSARAMIEALIAGERDPRVLAELALGVMRAKHDRLVEALDGMFTSDHAAVARILLDQIDFLARRIDELAAAASAQLDAIRASWGVDGDGTAGPDCGTGPDSLVAPAAARLAAVPGLSAELATSIIGETGLDMTVFPTAGHLVSWAGLCPRTIQSGQRDSAGKKHGNAHLRGLLGQAAIGAANTGTFLGERYQRIARRRGKAKAQVAVARSILVIIWHLLADPASSYHDLGHDWYQTKTDTDRQLRNHIRQIQALGYAVTLTQEAPAA